jgi:mycothiol synthase
METTTFTMRAPAEEDIPALLAFGHANSRRLGEEPTLSEDDVRLEWSEPSFERERHARIVEVDGTLVGTAAIGVAQVASSGEVFGGASVDPDHRGRGIGTALLDWVLETARSTPGARKLYTSRNVKQADAIAFLEANGFVHERSFFWMALEDLSTVPDPVWPEGIRPDNSLRGEALFDAIVEAHDNSFIDHWNFHPMQREQVEHWFRSPDVDPSLCFIARGPNHEIAGYNWCFLEVRQNVRRGTVGQLGSTRPFRGIGVGKALLLHGMHAMLERDPTEICIGVDTKNPSGAVGLYEWAGFRTRQENRVYMLEL